MKEKKEKQDLQILSSVGAVITDSHIVYKSGKHGSVYVNKDAVYAHTAKTSRLCIDIALLFADEDVDVVVAPAIGGVILSQWIAYHLSSMRGSEVLSVYAEKFEDTFVIKRGYDKLLSGKNVLVVEDVLTTGGSVKKVIEVTRSVGGNVIGLGALFNRGGVTSEDVANVPKLVSLIDMEFDMWDEADCPLCKEGVPINTDIGKGCEFLARK